MNNSSTFHGISSFMFFWPSYTSGLCRTSSDSHSPDFEETEDVEVLIVSTLILTDDRRFESQCRNGNTSKIDGIVWCSMYSRETFHCMWQNNIPRNTTVLVEISFYIFHIIVWWYEKSKLLKGPIFEVHIHLSFVQILPFVSTILSLNYDFEFELRFCRYFGIFILTPIY